MIVFVKLYATFRLKYEHYEPRQGIPLKVNPSAVVADILDMLKIDGDKVSLLRLNETQIKDFSHPLQEGDVLDVFPYVGGG